VIKIKLMSNAEPGAFSVGETKLSRTIIGARNGKQTGIAVEIAAPCPERSLQPH